MAGKSLNEVQKQENKSRGIPISDASLNEFEKTAKKSETISQRMTRVALCSRPRFLCQELYETGLQKPFLPRLKAEITSRKGGSKDKRKKGILDAIREILPKLVNSSPVYGRRFFQRNHHDDMNQFT